MGTYAEDFNYTEDQIIRASDLACLHSTAIHDCYGHY